MPICFGPVKIRRGSWLNVRLWWLSIVLPPWDVTIIPWRICIPTPSEILRWIRDRLRAAYSYAERLFRQAVDTVWAAVKPYVGNAIEAVKQWVKSWLKGPIEGIKRWVESYVASLIGKLKPPRLPDVAAIVQRSVAAALGPIMPLLRDPLGWLIVQLAKALDIIAADVLRGFEEEAEKHGL